MSTVKPSNEQAVSLVPEQRAKTASRAALDEGVVVFENRYSPGQDPSSEPQFLELVNDTLYVADRRRVWQVTSGSSRQVAQLNGDPGLVAMAASGGAVYWLSQVGQRVTLSRYDQQVVEIASADGAYSSELVLGGGAAYWLADHQTLMTAPLQPGAKATSRLTLPRRAATFLIHDTTLVVHFPEEQELGIWKLGSSAEAQRLSTRPPPRSQGSTPLPLVEQCQPQGDGALAAGDEHLYGVGTSLWRAPWADLRAIEHLSGDRCLADAYRLVIAKEQLFVGQPGSPDSMTRRPGVLAFNLTSREFRPWFDGLAVSDLEVGQGSLFVLGHRYAKQTDNETSQVRRLTTATSR